MDTTEIMTREEFSQAIGRSTRTLYLWQKRRYGPVSFSIGGRRRYYWAADVSAFLDSERERAIKKALEDGHE